MCPSTLSLGTSMGSNLDCVACIEPYVKCCCTSGYVIAILPTLRCHGIQLRC